ncbi:MAG: NAD(P)-binding domain-containing protein [Actinomycetota bacterium]
MPSSTETHTPVCLLGAGPHGLSMALHLQAADRNLTDEMVVIDPSGAWMSTWVDQFARLDIDILRSPSVHHPAPDVDALAAHTLSHRLPTSGLAYDLPTTHAFNDFCAELASTDGLRAPRTGAPTTITAHPDGGLRVHMATGDIVAERLIVASNPHRRTLPSWLEPLLGRSKAQLAHAADVDLRTLDDLRGERIVIVGGGLSAAHLALGATRRGAHVELLVRRALTTRAFDTEPGWLGPKYLTAYSACADLDERLAMAIGARGGGTMPQWMRDQLHDDRITISEGSAVISARATPEAYELDVATGRRVVADRLWLATGTTADITSLRALEPLLPDIAVIDGIPVVDDHLRAGLHPVYMMGRLAMLTLGPAAGNLWGARHASRRITEAITGIRVNMVSGQPESNRR